MRYLLKNARVVDGTGNPWTRASVAVLDGIIAEVGDITDNGTADEVIDVADRILCPGFVDMHAHSDYLVLADPLAENKVLQGITSEVAGLCGYSAAPIRDRWFKEWWTGKSAFTVVSRVAGERILGEMGIDLTWSDMDEYLDIVECSVPSVNYLTFTGHVALRVAATGGFQQLPGSRGLKKMQQLLRITMEQGSFGFSTEWGTHRDMELTLDELVILCREAALGGGRVAFHLRDNGDEALAALQEGLGVAEAAGARAIISHISVSERENWGKAPRLLQALEDARERGLEVVADAMPFPGAEALTYYPRALDLLPPHLAQLPAEEIRELLTDEAGRERVKSDMAEGEPTNVYNPWVQGRGPLADPNWPYYLTTTHSRMPDVTGCTIWELSQRWERPPLDALLDVLAADPDTRKMFVAGSEMDKRDICGHPAVGFGTDGAPVGAMPVRPGPEKLLSPFLYASFPYILRHYVYDTGVLSLEEAVRKMSSLPMLAHGIRDRGLVRAGCWADLVVFDPESVQPLISYHERFPRPPCTGIDVVMVNGVLTAREGAHTTHRGGRVIRKPS